MNDVQLSEHFWLHEFTASLTARMAGLCNEPPAEAVERLKNLCQLVLEPLRQWAGRPVQISSGYRSPAVNRAVGGVPSSQHLRGEAADLLLPSEQTGWLWFDYIRRHLPFDQLIWETYHTRHWIHVSCKADLSQNRRQVIEL